jgi:hypothetical protein
MVKHKLNIVTPISGVPNDITDINMQSGSDFNRAY